MTNNQWYRLMQSIAIIGLVSNGSYLIWHEFIRSDNKTTAVELTKADCIETCIRILQNQSVFPDYHRNVQHCNAMFAEVESCRLAK